MTVLLAAAALLLAFLFSNWLANRLIPPPRPLPHDPAMPERDDDPSLPPLGS